MDPQFRGAGGALEHLGQLGLSELDLLKLAASGGLNADAYTRSHSAEVARAQASAQQSTFSPSWPPHGSMGGGGADCDAAAVLARRGMPPLSPGSYLGGGALAGAGVLDHSPLGGAADLTYLAQLGAGATGVGPSAAFGEGPRIYVGGVPDLVTVAMVRDHFSRWGVVRDVHFPKERTSRRRRHFCFVTFESMPAAERAVAESNREIGGYPVAAINIPTDRLTHYGLRQASALSSPSAAVRGGLPFGVGSPTLPSGLLGGGHTGGSDAYSASPTRAQSHSGAYGVTHQVGLHRIRGTASAEFMATDAASQLAAASEQDLTAALAQLRLNQQQQAAAAAAANGYGSAPGSGVSTRQTSHDFSSVATFSGTASVGRGSQDYGGQPGSGGAPQQLGGAGGSGLNLAAGSDIYTVLANIQRNSAAAAQQQQQQRMSPQPASHMNMLHGVNGRSSAGATPLSTPPGDGFHPGGGSRPGSALDVGQGPQPQGNGYSFLGQGPEHQRSYSFEGSRGGLGLGPGAPQQQLQDIGSMRSHSAAYARSASPLARMSASGPPEARTGFQFANEPPAVHGNGSGNGGGGFGDHGGLPVSGAYAAMGQAPLQQYGSLQNQYMAQLQAQLATAPAPMTGGQAGGMAHSDAFASGSGAGGPASGGPAGGEAYKNNPNANNNLERHIPRPGSAASGLSNSFATAGPRSEPMQPQLQQAPQQQQPQVQQQAQGHRCGSADAADVESSSSLDAKMNASVSDLLRGSSSGSGQPQPSHQQPSHQQQVQQQAAAGEWRHSWDGDTLQQQQRGESHSLPRSGGGGFSVPTAFTNGFGGGDLVSSR